MISQLSRLNNYVDKQNLNITASLSLTVYSKQTYVQRTTSLALNQVESDTMILWTFSTHKAYIQTCILHETVANTLGVIMKVSLCYIFAWWLYVDTKDFTIITKVPYSKL